MQASEALASFSRPIRAPPVKLSPQVWMEYAHRILFFRWDSHSRQLFLQPLERVRFILIGVTYAWHISYETRSASRVCP